MDIYCVYFKRKIFILEEISSFSKTSSSIIGIRASFQNFSCCKFWWLLIWDWYTFMMDRQLHFCLKSRSKPDYSGKFLEILLLFEYFNGDTYTKKFTKFVDDYNLRRGSSHQKTWGHSWAVFILCSLHTQLFNVFVQFPSYIDPILDLLIIEWELQSTFSLIFYFNNFKQVQFDFSTKYQWGEKTFITLPW